MEIEIEKRLFGVRKG